MRFLRALRAIPLGRQCADFAREASGAGTVEMALVLPLIFLFFMACVEFGRVNVIRNSMENAAYEGAREGIVPGAAAARCRAACGNLLTIIGVNNAQIDVAPATIDNTTTDVTVTVTVPLRDNLWMAGRFFSGQTIVRSCTLTRELSE